MNLVVHNSLCLSAVLVLHFGSSIFIARQHINANAR